MNRLGSKSWLLLLTCREFWNFLTTLEIAGEKHSQCVNSNFLQPSKSPHLGAWTKPHALQIHTQPTPRHQQTRHTCYQRKAPNAAKAIPTNCLQEVKIPPKNQFRSKKIKLKEEEEDCELKKWEWANWSKSGCCWHEAGKAENFSPPPIAEAGVANVWNFLHLKPSPILTCPTFHCSGFLEQTLFSTYSTCMLPTKSTL